MSEPPSPRAGLEAEFGAASQACAASPFANPVLGFAFPLSRRLLDGDISLESLAETIRSLSVEAFLDRAERLGRYLGETAPERNVEALEATFEALAERGDFDAFRAATQRQSFGVVLTGHPTFSMSHEASTALVALATGRGADDRPLDASGRETLAQGAAALPQGPPEPLTLDVEHDWSLQALGNLADAVETATRAALRVGRRRWPQAWTRLRLRLMTLATWVGFDQDGRTDVTWLVSCAKRLSLKREGLVRLRATLAAIGESDPAAAPKLAGIGERLDLAISTVERQAALLAPCTADLQALPAFSRTMVEGRDAALVDPAPVLTALEEALEAASTDDSRERLLAASARLGGQGLSLAHIHVRLNAAQLHIAVRRDVGLETAPSDPANRRTYFAAIGRMLDTVSPQTINFGSLVEEPSSARRLMMTVAQMAKFIDASPVRFLVAESESGFTLLSALYLARLFAIEEVVEISPLFETAEGFETGEHLIEEALRSPAFRANLERHGRLAIEFGFSDSGRFIGQLAATFRIERLRLRLADLLVREGLAHLEVVFFNTHGESIGRGGHPAGLEDRFRYAAPPASRAEFARRQIRCKEEDSFQGGEGYLPLMNRPAALAVVRAALASTLAEDPEAAGDPIYRREDFASEFFATVQQSFQALVADPDYAALLGTFGTRMLRKTGSRPEQRRSETGAPRDIGGVHELRAIPNNGTLQQLGYLANTLYGVGRAAAKDPATFREMLASSPRFRRAMALVEAAQQASSLETTAAYLGLLDPDVWMQAAACGPAKARTDDEALSAAADRVALHEPLAACVRTLRLDALALGDALAPVETGRRRRLLFCHALRIALMAFMDSLGARTPEPASPGLDRGQVLARLMRLDVAWALERLEEAFPAHAPVPFESADFGEPAAYEPHLAHSNAAEHETVFAPIRAAHALALQLTMAVNHDLGACG